DVVERLGGMIAPVGVDGRRGIDQRAGEAGGEVVGTLWEFPRRFGRGAEQLEGFEDLRLIWLFGGHVGYSRGRVPFKALTCPLATRKGGSVTRTSAAGCSPVPPGEGPGVRAEAPADVTNVGD